MKKIILSAAAIIVACLLVSSCRNSDITFIYAENTHFTKEQKETIETAANTYDKNYLGVNSTLEVRDTTINRYDTVIERTIQRNARGQKIIVEKPIVTEKHDWPMALGCKGTIFVNSIYLHSSLCTKEHFYHVILHEMFHTVTSDAPKFTKLKDGRILASLGLDFGITNEEGMRYMQATQQLDIQSSNFEEASAEACAQALDPRRYNFAETGYYTMACMIQNMITEKYFIPRFLIHAKEGNDVALLVAKMLDKDVRDITSEDVMQVEDIFHQARKNQTSKYMPYFDAIAAMRNLPKQTETLSEKPKRRHPSHQRHEEE